MQNQPPSPLQLSKKQIAAVKKVTELNQHNCQFARLGQTRSIDAGNKKRQRSIRTNVEAVLDESNNREQQVLALRHAMLNKNLRSNCVSAGVVLDSSFAVHQCLGKNIKLVIRLLTERRHAFGRTRDDKRSVVQSIVMAWFPPTSF